jgi:hypothetical protein
LVAPLTTVQPFAENVLEAFSKLPSAPDVPVLFAGLMMIV